MAERWERERVLALAPDAPSQRVAQSLAAARAWTATGAAQASTGQASTGQASTGQASTGQASTGQASTGQASTGQASTGQASTAGPGVLWGECRGSTAAPYRAVVELSGPAYRCSCPSRKFPCKHVLALLLLWAEGAVRDDPAGPPEWAASWLAARTSRAQAREPGLPKDPKMAARRAEQREARVASGLAELDRWLCDQVRQGLAASQQAGYGHWDDMAARMVDAQAPGVAERLRALATVPHSGAGWDGRLLEEYAMLRLLAVAYRDRAGLPPPLLETVRSRIGFSLRQADVLANGQPVRDHWQVLARRDIEQDRIRTRRTWLRGRKTGRPALVLSFAAAGLPLDESLRVGTDADADLVFYPGAVPLRAVVQDTRDSARGDPPEGGTITGLLAGYASALAGDPWLDSWPAVLDVTPARSPAPAVFDADGDALPLHPGAGGGWPLFALSGGHPVTVAGEWTPRGLWPLTAWDEAGRVVPL